MGDPGASFSRYPRGGTIPEGGLALLWAMDPPVATQLSAMGFRFILVGGDIRMVQAGAATDVTALEGLSIYLSVFLSVCLSLFLSFFVSFFLSILENQVQCVCWAFITDFTR